MTTYVPVLYLVFAFIMAVAVRKPIAQAMNLDYDRSDTHDFVIAAMFVVIAALIWPMSLLVWWALPPRPESERL
ncbi:hypothetical protein ACFZCP_14855 [Streptomyces sp. NPDC007971]|uniref:hypothetical protein n=1 Tax=Streptomyces sp. NPDC007971 TaxID=3364799 RepID=UPI0036EF1977